MSRIQWRFDRVSRRVPVDEPWTSPIAEILDSKTLDEWLRYVHASAGTRDLMAIMARVTWGCEPDAVSMLHAVRYVKAAGGLDRMLDVEGGAQQDRFPDGTQQIALRMAEELGSRVVLDAVVRSIERHTDGTLTVDVRSRRRRPLRPSSSRSHPSTARASPSCPTCRRSTASSRSTGRRAT